MAVISGNLADGKPMQVGGWYNGQQWNGSKLSAPGTESNGNVVSNAVISQTNPNNVAFISQLKGNTNLPLPATSTPASQGLQSTVDSARATLQATIDKQQAVNEAKLAEAKGVQTDILNKEQGLSTPVVADMEAKQRQDLGVNTNFEANQKLTDELGTLLQQGTDLIKQQQSVTGLASVRNPRVQETMNDITARAGVIQAVLSARNNQISVAENMIDRSVRAVQSDRQQQLTYYNTLLQLNSQEILSLGGTEKDLANKQISLLENDLTRAQKSADYVKQLLIDPATAQLMGEAGVSLNDSVEQINAKIQQAQYTREVAALSNEVTSKGAQAVLSPNGVPTNQLITLTDSKGVKHYYQSPTATSVSTTQTVKNQFLASANSIKGQQTPSGYVGEFPLLVAQYAPYMSLQDIYALYSQSKLGQKSGTPKENAADIKQIYDQYRGKPASN